MSSRKTATRRGTTKKRAQRATSNVFAMFNQDQIQEFKEAFNMIDHNRWLLEDGRVVLQGVPHKLFFWNAYYSLKIWAILVNKKYLAAYYWPFYGVMIKNPQNKEEKIYKVGGKKCKN